MTYDKDSFLAGVSVGRTLKGWAAAKGEGGSPYPDYPGGYGFDTSDPEQVYAHMRPNEWVTMPTPAENELWMLMFAPVDGAVHVQFALRTAYEVDADGKTYRPQYNVSTYKVVNGSRVVVSSEAVDSGATYKGLYHGAEYGNVFADPEGDAETGSDKLSQILVCISGAVFETFNFVAKPNNISGSTAVTNFNVYEVAANLPKIITLHNGVSGGGLVQRVTKFFALYGENSITSKSVTFNNSAQSLLCVRALDCSKMTKAPSFASCISLLAVPELNLTALADSASGIFNGCSGLIVAPKVNIPIATSVASMFLNCSNMQVARDIDAPKATSAANIFAGCSMLEKGPTINAPLVTNASKAFQDCAAMRSCANINLPAATNISYIFDGCISLEEAPAINAPLCTDASYMFTDCKNIRKAVNINIPKAGTTFGFSGCSNLRTVKMVCAGCGTSSRYTTFNADYNLVDVEIHFHGSGGYVGAFYRRMRRCILTSEDGTAPKMWPATMQFCDTSISRNEAVELFQKIPTPYSSSPYLNFVTTPAAADLTDEDIAIAVAKGWGVLT